MTRLALPLIVVIAGCGGLIMTQPVDIRQDILEVRVIIERHADKIWPGLSAAPFGILLVEEASERLFCHSGSPHGFEMTGLDPVLLCPGGVRATSFPKNLQATFSAVDDVPIIVIGTPEATRKTINDWKLTIVHEHFHQMQFSWAGYYPGIADLELGGDDETGMWMLDYPFPYESQKTASAFRVMANDLIEALDARETGEFRHALKSYWLSRELARTTVSDAEWRYIELQLWQEGVARWTEGAIAALSADLTDAAIDAGKRVTRELRALDLSGHGRSALYAIGAAEAMLLETGGPNWRDSYWTEPFSLGPQLLKLVEQ